MLSRYSVSNIRQKGELPASDMLVLFLMAVVFVIFAIILLFLYPYLSPFGIGKAEQTITIISMGNRPYMLYKALESRDYRYVDVHSDVSSQDITASDRSFTEFMTQLSATKDIAKEREEGDMKDFRENTKTVLSKYGFVLHNISIISDPEGKKDWNIIFRYEYNPADYALEKKPSHRLDGDQDITWTAQIPLFYKDNYAVMEITTS